MADPESLAKGAGWGVVLLALLAFLPAVIFSSSAIAECSGVCKFNLVE